MINKILIYIVGALLLLSVKVSAAVNQPTTVTPTYIDSLNERAYRHIRSNLAQTLVLLTDAEQLCVKINYQKGLAINYLYQAEVFNQRGYSKRAEILYNHAIQLSRKNHDGYNIARAQEHLSSLQRRAGNLAASEKLLDSSLAIMRTLNKPIDLINLITRKGVLQEKNKHFAEALETYRSTYTLSLKANYEYGVKKSYYNRAELYFNAKLPDSSIYYYHKTLKIDTATNDAYGKALSYLGLGQVYLQANNLPQAMAYAHLAEVQADSIHANDLLIKSVEILLKASEQQKNLAAIIQWQQRLLQITRKTSEADRNDAMLFVEVLKDQQEKQLVIQKAILGIQKESQAKSIILLCILVVMLVAVLLVFSISYNYKRTKVYAAELSEKNNQINEHANYVASLNKKITGQNTILEEDNNLKNRLLSIISHDLRHPLTNTKSILDLVNLNLITNQEASHLFQHLETQYAQAINLLDNLLYWIKSQVHDGAAEKKEVNLHQMMDSLIAEQKISLQKKEIQACNFIDETIVFYAEHELLKIIFRNLLTNAIKFTNHQGSIQFGAVKAEGGLKVFVKDNGIGMSEDTLKRINSQNHYTSKGTANEDGSGMGLMLIRDLIKKIKGSLHIDSQLGAGSTFTVSLVQIKEPLYLAEVE